MKRTLILVLALLMVLSLFAGCGGNGGTTPPAATDAPAATQAPATKAPATQAPAATEAPAETEAPQETEAPPEEPGLPFAVDENGIATEQYNWPLPLTENDKPFTYWTCCWTPEYLPEDGFGATELPIEAQKRTGVNVEYVLAPTTSRNEAFSVMLAADDLCDMCCNASSYYPGTVVEMVEDGYFVNVYDYREYMPNYLWHCTYEHPEDTDTKARVFYYDDFVPIVYSLAIKFGEMIGGYTIREDLMDQVGMKIDDLIYWQDWEDALMAIKVADNNIEYPLWFARTLELGNYWQWHSYGSMTAIPTTALPSVYLKDGQVQLGCTTDEDLTLMQQMNKWYGMGLITPNWTAYSTPNDYAEEMNNDQVACTYNGATNLPEADGHCSNPNCRWKAMQKPVLEEGQIFHTGKSRVRTGTGNCSFASTCYDLPTAMKWIDYRYSPEGYELYTYGPDGIIVYTDENGERHNTDWALNNPDGKALTWLAFIYSMDAFVDPALADTETKLFNPAGDKARVAIAYWTDWLNAHYDAAGLYPVGANLTTEQSEEISQYRNELATYIAENFSMFMDGTKPFSEWDSYVETLRSIGLDEVKKIYQDAYEDYLEREAA
jgi:DNA polymerase III, alpha subunit